MAGKLAYFSILKIFKSSEIYIFGGKDLHEKNEVLDSIYKYDICTKTWAKHGGTLFEKCYNHSSAASRDGRAIYVYGGVGRDGRYSSRLTVSQLSI